MTKYATWYQLKATGLGVQQVWTDRILDKADQTGDPLHLMHVSELSSTTAVKYVRAALPKKFIAEPTMAWPPARCLPAAATRSPHICSVATSPWPSSGSGPAAGTGPPIQQTSPLAGTGRRAQ